MLAFSPPAGAVVSSVLTEVSSFSAVRLSVAPVLFSLGLDISVLAEFWLFPETIETIITAKMVIPRPMTSTRLAGFLKKALIPFSSFLLFSSVFSLFSFPSFGPPVSSSGFREISGVSGVAPGF